MKLTTHKLIFTFNLTMDREEAKKFHDFVVNASVDSLTDENKKLASEIDDMFQDERDY